MVLALCPPGGPGRGGIVVNGPHGAGGRCMRGSQSSTAGAASWYGAAAGRFDRVRGGAAGYAARPGDRGQARRGVPVDLHPARRGARGHSG